MSNTLKIAIAFLLSVLLFLMSPFILYKLVDDVWSVYCMVDQYIEDKTVEKASKSIEQLAVNNDVFDIKTVVFGISNSEIEYEIKDSRLLITNLEYKMGSGVFNNFCTHWLHSYNTDGNDVQLINDICKVLNKYDLDFSYVDGYSYRGFYYKEGYVYGRYDESYLNGQYLEISLRPIEGPNIIIRFDLDLNLDSVEYQIANDLRGIENASDEYIVGSFYNLLGLINSDKQEQVER